MATHCTPAPRPIDRVALVSERRELIALDASADFERSPTVFHMARLAREPAPDHAGPSDARALRWILDHQRGDGTWGGRISHHHDRVVSTLAAMSVLMRWRELAAETGGYADRLEAASWGLAPHVAGLARDPFPTIDFDRTAGALVAELRWRGWRQPLGGLATAASAGFDPFVTIDDAPELTALAALCPFTLLARDEATLAAAAPGLTLARAVMSGGRSSGRRELALAFRLLSWAGEAPAVDPLIAAAIDDRSEGGPRPLGDVEGQVHLLCALQIAPAGSGRERAIRGTIGALARSRGAEPFWLDRGHASPYPTTAQAVIGLGGQLTLAEEAVQWMVETQRRDGSWGFYDAGSAEETANCLLALVHHRARGGLVPAAALERGAAWLAESPERVTGRYAPLAMGRTLVCPARAVHATVLAALTACAAEPA